MSAGEGRSGLGSPAGAGPSRLPARSPQPRGGSAAELPSYQVTAGFGRCSLARPQPIRERRRCSRAGGLPTRAPSPDTQRSTLTQSQGFTHVHCPRDAQHHTHTITETHTATYMHGPSNTQRQTHSIAQTRAISVNTVPGHSTDQTHNHNDTRRLCRCRVAHAHPALPRHMQSR